MWMPGLAQLDPQTADRAKTVHWPSQKGTQHGSWRRLSWPCETCQVSGMPGAAQSLRTATHGGMPLHYRPLVRGPSSPLQRHPRLKANSFVEVYILLYIVWNSENTKSVYIWHLY